MPQAHGLAPPRAPPYDWTLPPGFPVPQVPSDNPITAAKVELGRHLFYDERLSGNGTYACATCHRQELAFTDGRARAVGSTGEVHPRSAMSLANVAYNVSYNWANPEHATLESQARVPMLNDAPVELGLREADLLVRLRRDARYARLFDEAFPRNARPVTLDNVIKAIASFERTLISGDSPYDRLVYGGEMSALSPAARRGMRLFYSERLGCFHCHGEFTLSGPIRFVGAVRVEPEFHNTGLYDVDGRGGYPGHDRGLLERTGRSRDMGRFRAPTLRNIELTAPYMHDGSIATLDEVLEHYARGGRAGGKRSRFRSPRLRGFALSDDERADLLAFLRSLTDRSFVTDPRFADPFAEDARTAAN